MQKRTIETDQTELGSLLEALVGRVRSDGLAVLGFAADNFPKDSQEHRTLEALAESIQHRAGLLDAARSRLCQDCQMIEVSERRTFGAAVVPAPSGRRARKGAS